MSGSMGGGTPALNPSAVEALNALFAGAKPTTVAAPTEPEVTLRYGTLAVKIPQSNLRGRSIGELFKAQSEELGGVDLDDNVSIKDTMPGAGVVDTSSAPVAGRTYVLSIRKEDKGS